MGARAYQLEALPAIIPPLSIKHRHLAISNTSKDVLVLSRASGSILYDSLLRTSKKKEPGEVEDWRAPNNLAGPVRGWDGTNAIPHPKVRLVQELEPADFLTSLIVVSILISTIQYLVLFHHPQYKPQYTIEVSIFFSIFPI